MYVWYIYIYIFMYDIYIYVCVYIYMYICIDMYVSMCFTCFICFFYCVRPMKIDEFHRWHRGSFLESWSMQQIDWCDSYAPSSHRIVYLPTTSCSWLIATWPCWCGLAVSISYESFWQKNMVWGWVMMTWNHHAVCFCGFQKSRSMANKNIVNLKLNSRWFMSLRLGQKGVVIPKKMQIWSQDISTSSKTFCHFVLGCVPGATWLEVICL